ncbi:hypothetical protein HO173_003960 [Letharia columbiana]|uniref:Uncharacterized protein n=1 Tax=Letharia columbiana TaxID=112416 RepID=A0A8H6L6Y5_9LECA|nr:uncharacterized protein HO173_003960 [Letharia columbiana]KAF6237759.1 hypothetical protein HO173_003960 [Letharia columbiana]
MIAHAPTDLKTRDDNYSNCSSNWYSGNSSRILLDAQYDLQHCHPWLQAPPRLEALDPAWANCFRSLDINDPPRALTAADFVAPTPLKHSVSLSVAAPSPGPQAAQPTPSPTPPPSTPAPGGAADSKSASGIPDHPTPAKDPVSADPIAETDAPVATLKHFIDPAPAQNSATSDTNSNEDPGVAAFKPSNDPATVDNSATTDAGVVAPNPTDGPASTKDPGTSDPNVDYGLAIVASESANGPGFPNLATSGPNGGKNSDVVVPQPAKHPADPSGSNSTDQQPNRPFPNTNGEPYTPPSVHAAAPVQAPFVTTVDGHDNIEQSSLCHKWRLVLGNSTIPPRPSLTFLYFPVGGETMTLSAAHLIAVGKTFAAGDQGPTIDSEVVSLGSTALTIRTPTVPLGAENSSLPSVATIAADKTVTLVPSGIIVQNANLTSNGPAVTASGPDNHRTLKRHRNRRHSINSGRAHHHKFRNTRIGWKRQPGNWDIAGSPRELGFRSDSRSEGLSLGGLNGGFTAAPGTSSTSNGTAANITCSANGPMVFPGSAGKVKIPGGDPPERFSNDCLKRIRQLFGHLHSGRQPRYRIRRARSVRNQLERDPA